MAINLSTEEVTELLNVDTESLEGDKLVLREQAEEQEHAKKSIAETATNKDECKQISKVQSNQLK